MKNPYLPPAQPKTISTLAKRSIKPKELRFYHNDIYTIFKWLENNLTYEIANKIFFKFGGISKTNPIVPLLKELRFSWEEVNMMELYPPNFRELYNDRTLHNSTLTVKHWRSSNPIFSAGTCGSDGGGNGRCSKWKLCFDGGAEVSAIGDESNGRWSIQYYPLDSALDPIDIHDRCANWWLCKSKHNGNMLCCLQGTCDNYEEHSHRLVCEVCRYNAEDCNTLRDKLTGEIITPSQSVSNLINTGRKHYYRDYQLSTLEKLRKDASYADKFNISLKQQVHLWKALSFYKSDRGSYPFKTANIQVEKSCGKFQTHLQTHWSKNASPIKMYLPIEDVIALMGDYPSLYGLSRGFTMIKIPKGKDKHQIFGENLQRYLMATKYKDEDYEVINTKRWDGAGINWREFSTYLDHDIIDYDIFKFIKIVRKLGLDEGTNCSNANAIKTILGQTKDILKEKVYWFIRNTFYENKKRHNINGYEYCKKIYLRDKYPQKDYKRQKQRSNPKLAKRIFTYNRTLFIEVEDFTYL